MDDLDAPPAGGDRAAVFGDVEHDGKIGQAMHQGVRAVLIDQCGCEAGQIVGELAVFMRAACAFSRRYRSGGDGPARARSAR